MRKIVILSALIPVAAASGNLQAESMMSPEQKRDGTIFSSAVAGGAVGGPLGMLVGTLAGVWLGDQVEGAERYGLANQQLSEANQTIETLQQQLARSEQSAAQFAQVALDQLELELLFRTGERELTAAGQRRISYLAKFLVSNPELSVRLDGYADPRGGSEFNLTLSEQRVAAVAGLLAAEGVEVDRIDTYSHGATESVAAVGDYDAYAMERVVKIALTRSESDRSVAQVTLSN